MNSQIRNALDTEIEIEKKKRFPVHIWKLATEIVARSKGKRKCKRYRQDLSFEKWVIRERFYSFIQPIEIQIV